MVKPVDECPKCLGAKVVVYRRKDNFVQRPCGLCGGHGVIPTDLSADYLSVTKNIFNDPISTNI